MSYRMFIDDERFPPDDGQSWRICRSALDVEIMIDMYGFPNYISFDHDLGESQPTGYDITKWMVDRDLDINWIPQDFTFYVHSQNPIGKRNIEMLLTGYLGQR